MAYSGYERLRALVVDDFDNFRMTVNKMLLDLGVQEVDIAVNGNDALRYCDERSYDFVLCDYNLGMGKNGLQVLEQLRFKKQLSHQSLFILVSAESSKSIVVAAYDSEPDAYLTKPITGKTLQQRLDRLLCQRDELVDVYRALDQEKIGVAVEACRQKIAVGSRYTSQCQKLLGQLYLQMEDYEAAEQLYRKVLEVRPLDWAKVGLAKVKKALGDVDMANEWLKDIVGSNPMCMQAYDVLADSYRKSGDSEQMQAVLQQAVNVSPMALLRQQRLGEVADANNDLEVAAKAYRNTVKLGEHSCYDRMENHLNFGRTTAALFKENDKLALDLSRDAVRVMEELASQGDKDASMRMQSKLIGSQLCVGQGNSRRAGELLSEAEATMEKLGCGFDVDTQLEFIQAMVASSQKERAKEKLEELIECYRDEEDALQKIDRLLEEPLSVENRQRVSALNKEGIGYYDRKCYKEAINCFKHAKRLFPNHIGVHLNLVQALVAEMREFGRKDELMALCLGAINKAESLINSTHVQFNRYRQLQDMVNTLGRDRG